MRKLVLLFVGLAMTSSAYAQRGCCSHHGGVAGCDTNTGYQLCRDGTDSPSCTCSAPASYPSPSSAPQQSASQSVSLSTAIKDYLQPPYELVSESRDHDVLDFIDTSTIKESNYGCSYSSPYKQAWFYMFDKSEKTLASFLLVVDCDHQTSMSYSANIQSNFGYGSPVSSYQYPYSCVAPGLAQFKAYSPTSIGGTEIEYVCNYSANS